MTALFALGAYLLGSIPFSFLVARAFGVRDVREVGSGNVGATNVMRSAGKKAGLLALALDAAKGWAATALAVRLDPDGPLPAVAACAVVLGHVFPVWLRGRGGKGVATGAGAFLPLQPGAVLAALLVFAATAAATRYVSLGSMAGAASLAAALLLLGAPRPVAWAGLALALLITAKHHENIARLLGGRERRLRGGR